MTFTNPKAIAGLVTWGEGQEADASWTSEWNFVVSATEGMGAFDRIGTFDPHGGLLRFPLAAGRRWPFAYAVTLPRRGDLLLRYEGTVTALGFEDVVVPAGKFRALKLTAQATFRRVDPGGGFVTPSYGSSLVSVWYVPEVKRWVKYESRQTTNVGAVTSWRRDELRSFSLR